MVAKVDLVGYITYRNQLHMANSLTLDLKGIGQNFFSHGLLAYVFAHVKPTLACSETEL